jgi:quercetin dioxygenase-like cupin family protein
MATVISESSVSAEPLAPGVERRRLLTEERVKDTRVLLDRRTLAPGATAELRVPRQSLVWFQVLEGEAALRHAGGEERLSPAHIVFLPPRFIGALATRAGAALLHAEIPEAARFDPTLARKAPPLRVVDWTREPVLDSRHDRRKRIYVVTPQLFGTTAIKGEMIIYPPGTAAPRHHHEGAEHFMYFTQGRGTAWANESPFAVQKGDLVYYGDRERHYLKSEGREDMVFVEFFVPGVYETIWAPGVSVCTWLPTGRDIEGRKPARDIAAHDGLAATPADV